MTWSFSIGRLFGTDVRVHLTFFLLLAWVGYAAFAQGGWPAAVENTLFVLALFACVLAHEFGHALAARRYGIRTPDITLLPIGGMARLERMPETPKHEIIMALAGPAVNVVIFLVLVLALGARIDPETLGQIDQPAVGFLTRLAMVNLFLAVFNMIPAFPMAGGRVLRAALSLTMDRVRATRAAATAGQGVAFVFGFWGLSSGNPVLVLIAFFVFIAANAEAQDVAMRAISRSLMARDAMITQFESLAPTDHVEAASTALIRTTQHEFPVITPDGALHGFVTRNAIFGAVMEEGGRNKPVTEIMEVDIPRKELGTGLEEVLNALHAGTPAVAICQKDGQMLGYVTRENVGELMVIKGR